MNHMKSKNSRPDKDDDASIPHMHAGWSMSSEVFTPADSNIAEVTPSLENGETPAGEKPEEKPTPATAATAAIFAEDHSADQEAVQTPPPPPVDEIATGKDSEEKHERGLRIFWTVGATLSILLNCILVVMLIVLGNQLFTIKKMVGLDLIGGLYANFVKMDQASIKTTITVSDQIPVNFNLPISQDTVVTLTQPTSINGARVTVNTGGLSINNAPADIILPAGTTLPIHLQMTVPVQQTLPITLQVPVDIPLNQTELHEPFVGLQQVVSPLFWLLKPEWGSCKDIPILGSLGPVCTFIFKNPK
jgi:hypothetical protein